jgi:DHA1 family tetracycline resistance protein-like MFS transporter
MGWGLIIPVMPDLLTDLTGVKTNEASSYGAWLMFAYAGTQFICAPFIGNLSDRFGRRPVLLGSLIGFSIDYIFLALAPTYGWLFVGRIIAGMTGASFTTGAAYIADISTPENRVKNFGLIGAAFGLGFFLGPMLGGLVSGWGIRAPFYTAAGLCLLNALYGYFVLPESLDKEHRRKFEWKRANPFGAFKFLQRNPSIGSLAVCYFLIYLAAMAVQATRNFYTEYRFQWTRQLIGISLAVVGLLVGGVQVGLTRILNPRLGHEKSIYLGLLLYSIGLILFAFANEGWMMFVFLVPYCMGGIAGPALQGTMASHVPKNEQGELQGALTALMCVTSIIGPLIMNNLFKYFTTDKAPIYFP